MKMYCNLSDLFCRRRSSFYFCIVVGCILFSCSPDKEEKRLTSEQYLKLTQFATKLGVPYVGSKMMLIIPTQGCASCIQSALEFTSRNYNHDRLSIVVSGRGKKTVALQLKKFGVDPKQVILDNDGLATRSDLISIYPVLFYSHDDYTISVDLDAGNIKEELAKVEVEF